MASDPHPASLGPPRARRPAPLTRARVAEAALAVGFPDLTLTAVAGHLGVTHAALYTHVVDRDDLVLAAAERVVAARAPPEAGRAWREDLEAEAWLLWDTFATHPGMVAAVEAIGRVPVGVIHRFAATCRRLVAAGFAIEVAMVAADTVYDLAVDASTRSGSLSERSPAARRRMAAEWSEPLDAEMRQVMAEAVMGDPRSWFARKLAIVLDGIAAQQP